MALKSALAAATMLAVAGIAGSAHAAWHKGFVVEYYALEHVWGDKAPDQDPQCPQGYNIPNWRKVYKTAWRTDAEVEAVVGTPGKFSFGTPLGNRGPFPGMNVYRDPTLIPDPGMQEVATNIAYGFDLDGNPATGQVTPDGATKGVDNAVYKAMGCLVEYRGPPHKLGRFLPEDASYYPNDEMRQGVFTMLIMVSGEGNDPQNDPNVKVGFYIAKEQLQKQSNNEITADVSYRVDPDPRFMSLIEAQSVKGVITPKGKIPVMNVRDAHTRPYFVPELILKNAKFELKLRDDGNLEGMLGGYRNWKQLYLGWAAGGSTTETARQVDLVGLWYALERRADGDPDAETGKNTTISAAYKINAVPAFLITPDSNTEVTKAELFKGLPREAGPERETVSISQKARGLGGSVDFYLDGGAAAWPRKPIAGLSQLDRITPQQKAQTDELIKKAQAEKAQAANKPVGPVASAN